LNWKSLRRRFPSEEKEVDALEKDVVRGGGEYGAGMTCWDLI